MNERKSFLDELINSNHNHLIKDYAERLILKMLDYFEIYDLDKGTGANHYPIFKALYRSKKKKTYEDTWRYNAYI